MTGEIWLRIAAISGFLTVALGAFGAHGLEGRVSAQALTWWDKAVHYQGLHTLALLGCAILALQFPAVGALRLAGWGFLIGMLLFCGSLFVMTLTGQRWLGMVTPLGGLAMLFGWGVLVYAVGQLGSAPQG